MGLVPPRAFNMSFTRTYSFERNLPPLAEVIRTEIAPFGSAPVW